MNPRRPSPTGPKPVSFDQTRTPPPILRHIPLLDIGKILTVLVKLKNLGLSDNTLRSYRYRLERIAKHVDLDKPELVSRCISNVNGSNAYKESFAKAYSHCVRICGLSWSRPRYKYEREIPRIPTKEAIEKIIARSSRKYATIFRLLAKTCAMPHELHRTALRDIDLDKQTIAIQGLKGHSSRIFKLRPQTAAMLSIYLKEHGHTTPLFPNSKAMLKAWTRTRNELAKKLQEPQLKAIRLYDLRHYYATMTYHRTKDILFVKQQLGHKKLETTLIYTQLVNFGEEECTAK